MVKRDWIQIRTTIFAKDKFKKKIKDHGFNSMTHAITHAIGLVFNVDIGDTRIDNDEGKE